MLVPFIIGVLGCLAAAAIFAHRLDRSPVTLPMICLSVGLVLWLTGGMSLDPIGNQSDYILRIIAEITLAIVLFADASNLRLSRLRDGYAWPLRMLVIGLPLAIVIGSMVNFAFLPQLGIWSIILLAALLAPTDAALGASVFTNTAIPEKVRDSVLAESGLNDGLALPFIIFAACAAIGEQHQFAGDGWLVFAAKQVGLGVLIGLLGGSIGGFVLNRAINSGLTEPKHGAMFVFLLIGIVFFSAEEFEGNSFVAVFVAGLFFGKFAKDHAHSAREFLEAEGLLLTMASFVFIGAFVAPKGIENINWQIAAIVLLSLFIVRPLAIWLSLLGSGISTRKKLFLGWFGPRGLATALFTVFVLIEFDSIEYGETLISVTALAVVCSTFLHGISAYWAAPFLESEK
ncbi:MAG: cation:proton antiporter [Pseudomonadota bacterium]